MRVTPRDGEGSRDGGKGKPTTLCTWKACSYTRQTLYIETTPHTKAVSRRRKPSLRKPTSRQPDDDGPVAQKWRLGRGSSKSKRRAPPGRSRVYHVTTRRRKTTQFFGEASLSTKQEASWDESRLFTVHCSPYTVHRKPSSRPRLCQRVHSTDACSVHILFFFFSFLFPRFSRLPIDRCLLHDEARTVGLDFGGGGN